jgi:uncharacterized protein (TIGR02391 family)
MNVGNGPEDLPQFEDRFLYHLVDLAGDRPMGPLEGVADKDVIACLTEEFNIKPEFIETNEFYTSPAYGAMTGAIEELTNGGLIKADFKETNSVGLRPTGEGRRLVTRWREEWEQRRGKQDREVQRLILRELERQWRADPERHKLGSRIDVERFCEENGLEQNVYLANAHRLIEQGKIATTPVDEASPASGHLYITESGRKVLEVVETAKRPQPDAQEAYLEVARLKRRLQIAERRPSSLIADDELRRRCEDLLAAEEHHDRVIREACVILEDRVRKAVGADKSLVGTSLMEQSFGPNKGVLRLSDDDKEQRGAMELYRGVMAFFRNDAGHNVIDTYTQEDALRFVVFVDLLLAMVGKVSDQQDTGEI